MVLVDTSIWIDHLRKPEPGLIHLLESEEVMIHPFIIGELACGTLQNREVLLYNLGKLPRVPLANDIEVHAMIENRGLMGKGVGYLDMHLLATVLLGQGVRLWTRDRKLAVIADELSVTH